MALLLGAGLTAGPLLAANPSPSPAGSPLIPLATTRLDDQPNGLSLDLPPRLVWSDPLPTTFQLGQLGGQLNVVSTPGWKVYEGAVTAPAGQLSAALDPNGLITDISVGGRAVVRLDLAQPGTVAKEPTQLIAVAVPDGSQTRLIVIVVSAGLFGDPVVASAIERVIASIRLSVPLAGKPVTIVTNGPAAPSAAPSLTPRPSFDPAVALIGCDVTTPGPSPGPSGAPVIPPLGDPCVYLSGELFTASGRAVVGASVEARSVGNDTLAPISVLTDAGGRFSLSVAPRASWLLLVNGSDVILDGQSGAALNVTGAARFFVSIRLPVADSANGRAAGDTRTIAIDRNPAGPSAPPAEFNPVTLGAQIGTGLRYDPALMQTSLRALSPETTTSLLAWLFAGVGFGLVGSLALFGWWLSFRLRDLGGRKKR